MACTANAGSDDLMSGVLGCSIFGQLFETELDEENYGANQQSHAFACEFVVDGFHFVAKTFPLGWKLQITANG